MDAAALTDAELAHVAAVATREGWTDLASPPLHHGPRSLAEHAAVARFTAAARARRRPPALSTRVRLRLALLALTALLLAGCWYVSPSRTALGLLAAGLFSLVSLRRRRRRERPAPAGGWRRALS